MTGQQTLADTGASPRGRRNPKLRMVIPAGPRRISAWAEEPCGAGTIQSHRPAHLRVGGGTSAAQPWRPRCAGASPRGRRNLIVSDKHVLAEGRISAWAEEPALSSPLGGAMAAHLRVGGGTAMASATSPACRGASPRGRRNLVSGKAAKLKRGRISAWAEEPCRPRPSARSATAHLRVGGGTARTALGLSGNTGASPRGRRNQIADGLALRCARRISAWAEEPPRSSRARSGRGAHLRVGGGTSAPTSSPAASIGASPRGRRNRLVALGLDLGHRRISAWAEEPAPGSRLL